VTVPVKVLKRLPSPPQGERVRVRGALSERAVLKLVAKLVPALHALCLRKRPLTPAVLRCRSAPLDGGESDFHICVPGSHGAHQFFVTRTPKRRGSVRNTFVVRPLSSLFRNVPVISVTSKMFLTYPITCQPFWLVKIKARLTFV